MKITKSQLKRIIKEELEKVLEEMSLLNEVDASGRWTTGGWRGGDVQDIVTRDYTGNLTGKEYRTPSGRPAQRINPTRATATDVQRRTGAKGVRGQIVPRSGGQPIADIVMPRAGSRKAQQAALTGAYRTLENSANKAQALANAFGRNLANQYMRATMKGASKKALAKLALQALARWAGPVGLVYTAVDIADMLANHYFDNYGGANRKVDVGPLTDAEKKELWDSVRHHGEVWDKEAQAFPSQISADTEEYVPKYPGSYNSKL